jgi:hypothetical protein
VSKARIARLQKPAGLDKPPPCPACSGKPKIILADQYYDPATGEPYLLKEPGYGDDGPAVILPDPPNPPCPTCGERAFLIEAGCTSRIYRPRDAGPDWQID